MSASQETPASSIPAPSNPSDSSSAPSQPEEGNPPADNQAEAESASAAVVHLLNSTKHAREIVRLIQCTACSRILEEPTTLPCGYSVCKRCIPEDHLRTNISWPATGDRLRGFQCPFAECGLEHALGDCSVDVTLNKAIGNIRHIVEQGQTSTEEPEISTHIQIQDQWNVAGVPSLVEKEPWSQVFKGGRIVSTYTLVGTGDLQYAAEVTYAAVGPSDEAAEELDATVFLQLKEAARTEMDCQVCYALYLDPLTTACGHTFCRNCLHRVLDHSQHCPICRRALSIQSQLTTDSFPSNHRLGKMTDAFWADTLALRAQAVRLEQQSRMGEFDSALFVVAISFPRMPTFLHVFEPRYRLMIRRAMEGDRTFGMVQHRNPIGGDDRHFAELGTLLRIVNIEFFPDGRSILETVGISRFRVLRHGWLDGYVVAKIEKIDDISIQDEEAMEAADTRPRGVQDFTGGLPTPISTPSPTSTQVNPPTATQAPSTQAPPPRSPSVPMALDDLETMSTRELVQVGGDFVARMRSQSVPWLTARVLQIYGECPTDPALFPWWFGSIIPVTEEEKYRLLGTSSVRTRLKICCRWIIEWESRRWLV